MARDPSAPHVVEEDVPDPVVPRVTAVKRTIKADPVDAAPRPKKRQTTHDPFANVEEDVHTQSDEEEVASILLGHKYQTLGLPQAHDKVVETRAETCSQIAVKLPKQHPDQAIEAAAPVTEAVQPKPASPAKPQGPALLLAESYNINRDTPSIKG